MSTITIRSIGTSCPWRVTSSAELSPLARTLEAARTRPQVRAMLAAEAASAVSEMSQFVTSESASEESAVTFAGVTLDAPGFTSEAFERAVLRAVVDELQLHHTAGGDLVCHAGVNGGYHVFRDRCDCAAGQHGTPCKHRAYWILVNDVRLPAKRRQWAQLQRRQGGRVVA